MADNTVYQLTVGLNVSDDMTNPTDAAASAMNSLLHSVEALRSAGIDTTFQSAASAANDLNNSLVFDSLQDALGGVAPSAEEASEGLDSTTQSLVHIKSKASQVDKLLGLLGGRFKQLGQKVQEGQKWLEEFNGELGGGNGSMVDFEDATQKMAVGLGGAGERAFYMRSEMLSLVASTQFGVGEVTALAQGLSKAGVGLDEFGQKSQKSMIALAEVFGVAGEDIARTGKTMQIFGGSMGELLEDTTQFQQNFGVPGAFQALPQIIDGAMDSFAQFGGNVTGGGKQIAKSVTHMAGVYAKAFGKTMSEAVADAQATYSRFASATQTSRKVFLGLADDFDPLTKNLMQWNFGLHGSIKLAEDAKDNVVGFVGTMRDKLASLGGKDTFAGGRFLEQLREELPATVTTAIENLDAYEKMVGAQAEAERRAAINRSDGVKTFEDISNEMLNTTKELRNMWFNTKALIKTTLVQAGVMDALKDAFRGAKDVLADFGAGIQSIVESEGFQKWAKRLVPIAASVGKWVLLLGSAFGSLGGTVSALMTGRAGLRMLTKRFGSVSKNAGRLAEITGVKGKLTLGMTKLKGVSGKVGGALANMGRKIDGKVLHPLRGFAQHLGDIAKKVPGVSRVTAGFGKVIGGVGGKVASTFAKMGAKGIPGVGQIIAAIGGIGTGLMDMGDVLGDPNATGMAKFESLARGTIKGVVDFFDNLLLGIPSMIVNHFFPDLEDSFDRGFEGLFGGVRDLDMGEALGAMWDSAIGWIAGKLNNLDKFLADGLPDFRESLGAIGKTLGGALGGLVKGLVDFIIYGIKEWSLPALIYKAFKWAFSSSDDAAEEGLAEAEPGIMSALGGIINSLGLMAGSLLKGIGDGILGAFGTSLTGVGIGAQLIWNDIKEGAIDMTASIVGGILRFTSLFGSGMDILKDSGDRGWAMFKLAGLQAFSSIVDTFLGEGGMIASLMEGFEKLAVAFGQEDIAIQIANARKGMSGFSSDLQKDAKILSDQIAEEADLTAVWAAAQTKAKMAADEGTKGILGYKDAIAESNKALKAELDTEARKQEKQGLAGEFTRKAKKDVRDSMQQQLKSAAGFESLNAQAARSAKKNIRSLMDETISGLSKKVSEGTLSVEKAMDALVRAKESGINQIVSAAKQAQDKMTGKTAAGVGDAATGAGALGLNAKMMANFQRGLDRATGGGGGRQQVQVWLRGAGALDKEIAKKSAVKHLENGN